MGFSAGPIYLIYPVSKIILIAFSLNLIFQGYLSRKPTHTTHNLITLFEFDSFLIELDKCLIFFHVTYLSMMFWLIKDVITYFYYIAFWYWKSRTGILPFKFALTKFVFINKPFRAIRHYRGDYFFRNVGWPGDKKMHVFRICINRLEVTFIVFNYSSYVFFDMLPVRINNQRQLV